jgi:hypothetical protein
MFRELQSSRNDGGIFRLCRPVPAGLCQGIERFAFSIARLLGGGRVERGGFLGNRPRQCTDKARGEGVICRGVGPPELARPENPTFRPSTMREEYGRVLRAYIVEKISFHGFIRHQLSSRLLLPRNASNFHLSQPSVYKRIVA